MNQSNLYSIITHKIYAVKQYARLLNKNFWQGNFADERGIQGKLYTCIHLVYIVVNGVRKNRLPIQAAALSYYSLMGLGPILALILMISGFIMKENDKLATQALTKVVMFIAPQTAELNKIEFESQADSLPVASSTDSDKTMQPALEESFNPHLVNTINQLINNVRYGAVGGGVGTFILIFICIQLVTSIEKILNRTWGISRERPFAQRIFSYWTLLTLGGGLGIAGFAFLSASTVTAWVKTLPYGSHLSNLSGTFTPFLSFSLVALVLAFLYRFIPNTYVRWQSALVGGIIVAGLLWLNNYLSFLYIYNVIKSQDLYGSIGIIPVLMFGLFIFWVIFLLGGEITYAVQNVDSVTTQRLWSGESIQTREYMCLATFLIIARRFHNGEAPLSTAELTTLVNIPLHILNECLSLLMHMNMIHALEFKDEALATHTYHQPARSLDKFSLNSFHEAFIRDGDNHLLESLHAADPLLTIYKDAFTKPQSDSQVYLPLSQLL